MRGALCSTILESKKIVFVCHCVLNQNSISDGTADFTGTNEEIVKRLMEAKVGVVQLPCLKLMHYDAFAIYSTLDF